MSYSWYFYYLWTAMPLDNLGPKYAGKVGSPSAYMQSLADDKIIRRFRSNPANSLVTLIETKSELEHRDYLEAITPEKFDELHEEWKPPNVAPAPPSLPEGE